MPIDMNPHRTCPMAGLRSRTRCSSRRTSSPVARARRACSSRSGACSRTASLPFPAAAPSSTSARRATRYRSDPAVREEAGTPAIVESIRAGLVFQLKEAVGQRRRSARRETRARSARTRGLDRPSAHPSLGRTEHDRLPIVTFAIRHELPDRADGMLHSHFVVALLNDLFGIQARSGCFCAGPYIHRLVRSTTTPPPATKRRRCAASRASSRASSA